MRLGHMTDEGVEAMRRERAERRSESMQTAEEGTGEAVVKAIGIFVAIAVLSSGLALLGAYILTELWGWYVTPTTGWRVPSMATAYGLTCLVALLAGYRRPSDEDKERAARHPWRTLGKSYSERTAYMLLLWGAGGLVHSLWGAS